MEIKVAQSAGSETTAIGVYKDQKINGLEYALNDFEAKPGATHLVYDKGKKIILAGLGKKEELDAEKVRKAAASAASKAASMKLKSFAIQSLASDRLGGRESLIATAEGVFLSNYKFEDYKTEKDKKKIRSCTILSSIPDAKNIAKETATVCGCTLLVRDLVNRPASAKTPKMFADFVRKKCSGTKIRVTVFDEKKIRSLKMGGLLGVSAGSNNPPRFVILEYKGSSGKPTVLIGKGITFDSGGLSLKPSNYMDDMKSDMAGAATVFGTILAAAGLGLRKNLVGLMPLTENMPGGSAQKPGDIIRTFSGKTVEVLNTDAEGRLILADALAYSKKYKPGTVIDLATLTGACIIALGNNIAAVFTQGDSLFKKLFDAGEKTGERIWRLPLYEEFTEAMKGDISDLKNIADKSVGAGTATAAGFLSEFVEDKKNWAHLDIAGTAYAKKDSGYISKGGTGFGVRLLIEYLKSS